MQRDKPRYLSRKGRYCTPRKSFKKARHKKAKERAYRWFYSEVISGHVQISINDPFQ